MKFSRNIPIFIWLPLLVVIVVVVEFNGPSWGKAIPATPSQVKGGQTMVSKKGSRLMVRIYRATFMVCPVCQSFQFLPPRFHVKSSSLRLSQSYCERNNCRYLTFPCDLRSRELGTGDSRLETRVETSDFRLRRRVRARERRQTK